MPITTNIEGEICQFWCLYNPPIISFVGISDLIDLHIIWLVNLRIFTGTLIYVIFYLLTFKKSH